MKRNAIAFAVCLLLGTLAAWPQTVGMPVEGKVTQEGSPLPNVQVVLTNMDNGKSYKTKTDKSGSFSLLGVPYGNFQVEVRGEKGEKLFTERTSIGSENAGTSA